jgi:glycosyltransferase involved in cell wall biosynthesis
LLGQLLGIPAIFHFHGGNISDFIKKHPKWSFRVLNRAKYSITPSEYLKTSLEQNGVKVTIIPNYINIEAYPFVPRTKTEPKLVWLRSFHQIYNPTLAIHTLNLLRREYPKIYLNMAGMDKGDGSLQKTQVLIHTLGLSDNINISSQIKKSEVPTFLDRGDIYLNTTNIDNTPITVLEAMACGLCIVSTNVGGISYLLEDGVDALLVPSNDVESMTSAIKLILKEPELAETLSRNARKKAELIDWSNVLPLWENLFQDVLHHK